MPVAPADPVSPTDAGLLLAAQNFLEDEGLDGARVWRVEIFTPEIWHFLCSRRAEAGVVVVTGLSPRRWELLEWLPGWPIH